MKRTGVIVLILLAIALGGGLARFVNLRFSSGEIYPEYSTLRADPKGSKALFDSLHGVSKGTVHRNYESLSKLDPAPGTTLLLLGWRPVVTEIEMQEIEGLARKGTRVLLALDALSSRTASREADQIKIPMPTGSNAIPSHEKFWLKVKLVDPLKADTNRLEALLINEQSERLPQRLPWFGRYYFDVPTKAWTTIYELKNKPVLLQKKIGLGSIVLMADSFLFSNEALLRERAPQFLAWAAGASSTLVFDETHLGVKSGRGVAGLMREFRMTGLFIGLLLVAGLWIWKSCLPFVPPYPTQAASSTEVVVGKTAREALVHLLERNISMDELPLAGFNEWRKSHPNLREFDVARIKECESLLEAYSHSPKKERNPFSLFEKISKTLSTSQTS